MIQLTAVGADIDIVCGNAFNDTGTLCLTDNAGIAGSLMLHTGTDNGSIGAQKRHSLTLHVGTHQRTVCVVVFQEGNKCGCNGNDLTGRNVHVVDLFGFNFQNFFLEAGGNTGRNKPVALIQHFVCLGDDIFVLDIGRHIFHFIGNVFLSIFKLNLTIGCFNEAVFVDFSVAGQGVNQTDVGTFRRFDGAHSAVVRVVNVTHLEACALSGKTTGA